jgi:hypothetical protein
MAQQAKQHLNYVLPETLRRTLKKGEYAVYQLVDVFYTPDGRFSGRTAGIPNKDIILTKEGELLPIAFVEAHNTDGSPRFGNIWFQLEAECNIICLAGAKHAAMYNYLEISNYNESNPDRDPSITPVYRRVDSLNQSKQTRSQRSARVSALKAVISMSNEEVEKFLSANKHAVPVKMVSTPDGKKDFDAIRDSLEKWTEANPDRFLALTLASNPNAEEAIEEIVKKARAADIIGFDNSTKSWYSADGKPFFKVKSSAAGMQNAELVGYLKSADGQKILEKLKQNI